MLNDRIAASQKYFAMHSTCGLRYVDHMCHMMCGADQANYLKNNEIVYESHYVFHVQSVQMTIEQTWFAESYRLCQEDTGEIAGLIAECINYECLLEVLYTIWMETPTNRPYDIDYKISNSTGFNRTTPTYDKPQIDQHAKFDVSGCLHYCDLFKL